MIKREVVTAGALIRRPIRRWLMAQGVSFVEDKGLLDSTFVLTGEAGEIDRLGLAFRRFFEDMAREEARRQREEKARTEMKRQKNPVRRFLRLFGRRAG